MILRHNKRQTLYVLIGHGIENFGAELLDGDKVFVTGAAEISLTPTSHYLLNIPATVQVSGIHPFDVEWGMYQSLEDNRIWLRPMRELMDPNRFTRV